MGTEVAWQHLNRDQKPRLVVVNKMDKENADYYGALDAMRAQLNPRPVALHLPIGAEAGFRGVVDLMRMTAFVTSPDGKAATSGTLTISDPMVPSRADSASASSGHPAG